MLDWYCLNYAAFIRFNTNVVFNFSTVHFLKTVQNAVEDG